jgi:hypothetical protein
MSLWLFGTAIYTRFYQHPPHKHAVVSTQMTNYIHKKSTSCGLVSRNRKLRPVQPTLKMAMTTIIFQDGPLPKMT